MEQNVNLLDFLAVLYKWRRKILLFVFFTAIGTAAITLLLPNYYKATTIFYAASPDLAKPLSVGLAEKDIDFYGVDTDLDRLFSIAKSSELADYLINEFNLYDHYDIDSTKKTGAFNLRVKLNKLYKTKKNKYDALELSIEDQDPKFAADMANKARNKINEIGQGLIKSSQKNLLNSYQENIKSKEIQLEKISQDLIDQRNKYKIYSLTAQGEAYASSFTKANGKVQSLKAKLGVLKSGGAPKDSILVTEANLKGYQNQLNQLKKDVDLFNTGYTVVLNKELQQKDMVDQLSLDQERTKQLSAAFDSEFSSLHVVQSAEVPYYKSRPKRSFIVIGVSFLAGLLACLWVVLLEQYKGLNWKKVLAK